ncbi:MAG: cytochrome b [Hyphomicrobiales bacterium]|nr:cytochrome b [Hyphomicrobiales bacterium]MCP4997345.1 cytochrome b [Hyphomicrobiales bacterium]
MPLKSTPQKFGNVAVAIHWLSAFAIIALIVSGLLAEDTVNAASKAVLLRVHIPFGIAVLLLTLIRIGWWLLADRKPEPASASALQNRLSGIVHFLFYVAILGLGASGIGMLVLSGAGPVIFSDPVTALPDFNDYPPRTLHGVGAKLMIALLALHTLAAVYHQFIKRDGLLQRMWFGAR